MQNLLAANYGMMTTAPVAQQQQQQYPVFNGGAAVAPYNAQAAALPGAATYGNYAAGLIGAPAALGGYQPAPMYAQAGPQQHAAAGAGGAGGSGPLVTFYAPGANGEIQTGTSVYQQVPFGGGTYLPGAYERLLPPAPTVQMLQPLAAVGQPLYVQNQLQQNAAAAAQPPAQWYG